MKKYNSIIFVFLSFFPISSIKLSQIYPKDFYVNDTTYQYQAAHWAQTYILDRNGNLSIYPKELQILANLIYFSFQRSYITLEAQSTALRTIETVWNGWQNIAQTRLDPSKEPSYHILESEKRETIANFWLTHDIHQNIAKTYDSVVQNVVYGNCFLTVQAKDSMIDMRALAKAVVAQSLADVRQYVGQLFYQSKSLKSSYDKIIKFVDYLYEYLPKLAVNSFVEANKTNDLVSENSWAILMKIQQVGKRTWQMIEQERAAFYLAFYKQIWNTINQMNLDYEYRKIMFDTYGIIDITNQNEYLPDPIDLNPQYGNTIF